MNTKIDLHTLEVKGNIQTGETKGDLSGVKTYSDFDQMLANGGFDFVDICLPTFLHAEFSIKALRAGFPVFCEKPMALNADECESMIQAAEETGLILRIGQCLRFWPAYERLKNMIHSKQYGDVRSAHFSRFTPVPGWSADGWLLDSKKSGGPVLDLHIHDADMVQWIFGMPHAVHSVGAKQQDEIILITTEYDYEHMAISTSGGFVTSPSFPFEMSALVTLENAVIVFRQNELWVYPNDQDGFQVALPPHDGYFGELKDFVHTLQTGQESGVVSMRSAAESVLLCLAEAESVWSGKQVFLTRR